VKEAMTMRSSGHLLRRAGRKFVRNLVWWAVFFGVPVAILAAAVANFYLVGVLAFVGACVTVFAATMTVGELWSGAPDEPTLGSHDSPSPYPEHRELNTHEAYPSNWHGGGWDGGGGDGGGGG
jgi:uncharacterized membrane protein YgcG